MSVLLLDLIVTVDNVGFSVSIVISPIVLDTSSPSLPAKSEKLMVYVILLPLASSSWTTYVAVHIIWSSDEMVICLVDDSIVVPLDENETVGVSISLSNVKVNVMVSPGIATSSLIVLSVIAETELNEGSVVSTNILLVPDTVFPELSETSIKSIKY